MKKALTYTLVFVGIQLLAGGLVSLACELLMGKGEQDAVTLIATTAVAGIVTIVVFLAAQDQFVEGISAGGVKG